MRPSIDCTGWQATGNQMGCCYDYRAETKKFVLTLVFNLTLEARPDSFAVNHLFILNLEPFGPVQRGYLTLLLQSTDGLVGRFFSVGVSPINEGASICFLKHEDVLEAIKVLASKKDMRLLLKGPSETYADLPVPNASGFNELYMELYRKVTSPRTSKDDPFEELLTSLDQRLTLREVPFDAELMRQAKAKWPYDMASADEEYKRLVGRFN